MPSGNAWVAHDYIGKTTQNMDEESGDGGVPPWLSWEKLVPTCTEALHLEEIFSLILSFLIFWKQFFSFVHFAYIS